MQFAVTRDQVTLYVDCEETNTEQLEPRGQIDSDGTITIAKLADNQQTFPVHDIMDSLFSKKKIV